MGYFKNSEADSRAYGFVPTFNMGNDMRKDFILDLFPNYTSNKPSKKRAKVKKARKQKLKTKRNHGRRKKI